MGFWPAALWEGSETSPGEEEVGAFVNHGAELPLLQATFENFAWHAEASRSRASGDLARLIALSKAGGPSQEVSVLGCGRKSFQFGARFEELFDALQRLRLDSSSPYQHEDEGTTVDVINDKEELVPYRFLCAERLKISGCGQWDPTPYLSDLFYLPFVEPRCNEFEIEAPRHLIEA